MGFEITRAMGVVITNAQEFIGGEAQKTKAEINTESMINSAVEPVITAKVSRSSIQPYADEQKSNDLSIQPEKMAQEVHFNVELNNLKNKANELRHCIGPMNYERCKIKDLFAPVLQAFSDKNISFFGAAKELAGKIGQLLDIHNSAKQSISSLVDAELAPPKHLANGAVKQVWARDNVPDKVFYTALKGNSGAEAELKTEVNTTLKIKTNLEKEVLYDFLAGSIVPLPFSNKDDTIGLLASFGSVAAIKNEIETNTLDHKTLSAKDLTVLKVFFC